jgi:alkaline phosphatase D
MSPQSSDLGRPRLSRRRFVNTAGVGLAALIAAPGLVGRAGAQARRWSAGDPFSLGVASGAPRPDGFVLWTRLAPLPLSNDPAAPGGLRGGDLAVGYEIARDAGMRDIVRSGTAFAEAAYAFSVHLDVAGLPPGRPYWYRFLSGDAASAVGRAATLPAPGTPVGKLRFGFVSCANYEHGYFAAYRHLAEENPDIVLFLGDYIYEYIELNRPTVRRHSDGIEASTLPAYRNRYAQYRLDRDLQRLHAAAPSLVTWDDHEVQNDYADKWSQYFDDPEIFLRRRAAAYRAFYEHMPLRPVLSRPNGPVLRLYDRFAFGDLIEISLLDGRQYRSREACTAPPNKAGGHFETDASCPERRDPGRSLMGFGQEAWLFAGLARSKVRWNVVAQDMLMAQLRARRGEVDSFWTGAWDGYPANRARLLRRLYESRVANPVVVGGDIHSFFANDLLLNFEDPASPVVATEFVGTSVSSVGPPYERFATVLPDNPHVRFFESRHRGYTCVDLDPTKMLVRMRALADVKDRQSGISTLRTFVVEDGRPGAVAA